VQKFIIEHETVSIRKSLELRSQQLSYKMLEQREDFMDRKFKYEECKNMLPELRSQLIIYDKNVQILESGNSEEIKEILKRNRIPHDGISDLEPLKDLMHNFYNQKIEQTLGKCVQIFPDTEILETVETKDKLKHYRKLFTTFIEEAKKDEDYQSFLIDYKTIEKELKICERLLDNPKTFEDVVIAERGHSEDYLHYTLLDPDSRDRMTSQIPENANRFYFVVSSTRDSCDRCSDKMEQIAELFKDYFGIADNKKVSADGDDMDCKLLYFANQPMTRRKDGTNYVREYDELLGNLSDEDEDVINVMPQIYCREDMLMFSDYSCHGLPNIEKKFSSNDSEGIMDGEIDALDTSIDKEIARISEINSPESKIRSRTGSPERLFDNIPLAKGLAKESYKGVS
jgi:hypothetical protein